jgi:hypothetical protein
MILLYPAWDWGKVQHGSTFLSQDVIVTNLDSTFSADCGWASAEVR